MENLDCLHQLEILILYNNEISVIQGIDNLKKLTIFNIGKNKITGWGHVGITDCFLLSFIITNNILLFTGPVST